MYAKLQHVVPCCALRHDHRAVPLRHRATRQTYVRVIANLRYLWHLLRCGTPQGALHNLVVRSLMRGPHLVDPSSGAFPPRASVIILRVHAHTFAPATRCGASICNSAAAVCRASLRNTARRADHALAAHVPSLVRLVNQAETEEVDKLWTKLLPERSFLRSVEPCGAALRFGFALASARPRFALRRSGAAQHCAHCVMVSSGLATERALGRGRMHHATRMSRASS